MSVVFFQLQKAFDVFQMLTLLVQFLPISCFFLLVDTGLICEKKMNGSGQGHRTEVCSGFWSVAEDWKWIT